MLTIIVPTRNRPVMVKSQIQFYTQQNLPYRLVYIDASDPEIYEENLQTLKDHGSEIDCAILRAKPNDQTNPTRRINNQFRDHLSKFKTKYVCQSGDDDFYLVPFLSKGIARLEGDPSLASCTGACVQVTTKNDEFLDVGPGLGQISIMPTTNSLCDEGFYRVRENITAYRCATYGIIRKSVWKGCYLGFSEENMESANIEQLMSSVILASGKVDRLAEPLFVRHLHKRNGDSDRHDLSYDVFAESYPERTEMFCTQIGRILRDRNVPMPDDWCDQIRTAFRNFSMASTLTAYRLKVDDWAGFEKRKHVRDVIVDHHMKSLLEEALTYVSRNTKHGLHDPRSASFHRQGLLAPNT
jgi:glycosyltransferase domain-containing protein